MPPRVARGWHGPCSAGRDAGRGPGQDAIGVESDPGAHHHGDGRLYTRRGGRGVYFEGLNDQVLEVMTAPKTGSSQVAAGCPARMGGRRGGRTPLVVWPRAGGAHMMHRAPMKAACHGVVTALAVMGIVIFLFLV
jgi:hypothetical protein